MKYNIKTNGLISNQKDYGNIPYGKKGTISGNGCGSIACHNYLTHQDYELDYIDTYRFFNKSKNVVFNGKWGTNPFAIKRYLKNGFGLKVKMHFFHVPRKKLDSCIILYIFKHKKRISAHYIFGYMENDKFKTYNLKHEFEDIRDCVKKENTVGKLFVVYEIQN